MCRSVRFWGILFPKKKWKNFLKSILNKFNALMWTESLFGKKDKIFLTLSFRSKLGSRNIAGTLAKELEDTKDDLEGEVCLDESTDDFTLVECLGQCFLSLRRYLSKVCSGNWHTNGEEGMDLNSVKSSPQLRVKKSFCLPERKFIIW